MKARYLAAVATAFWGSSAFAAVIECPPDVTSLNQLTVTTSSNTTATCWDYGYTQNGQGNPGFATGSVVLDNATIELPAGTSHPNSSGDPGQFGDFLSGATTGATNGTFTVTANGKDGFYLLFKFGSGQATNNLWWYVVTLDKLFAGETIDWSYTGQNAVSHASLFDGSLCSPTDPVCVPGDGDDDDTDVPEPGSLALLGLGLIGLGYSRRRRA